MSGRLSWLLLCLGLALAAVAYWPGLYGGYVLDDFANVVDNRALAPGKVGDDFWAGVWSSDAGPTGRPLAMASFAVQSALTGLNPFWLKLGNLGVHLLNGLLVFLLLRLLLRRLLPTEASRKPILDPDAWAAIVAALWLLDPIQLTSVLYVVQRMTSLSATFVLMGLIAYVTGRVRLVEGRAGGWWLLGAGLVGGTGLAVLAKESGVLLPLYALVIEWVVFRFATRGQRLDLRLVAVFLFVLVLPGILGLLRLLPGMLSGAAYSGRGFDLGERLWTEGRILVTYLRDILLPVPNNLTLYHDDIRVSTGWWQPWTTGAGWAFLAGLLVLGLAMRRRLPLLSLGVLWFFAGHALTASVIPLELAYEHRNYLPALGVFLAVAGLLSRLSSVIGDRRNPVWRTVVLTALIGVLGVYATFLAIRAQIWSDPFRLAYFEATLHPESPRANYTLGRMMLITASGPDSPRYQIGERTLEAVMTMPGAGLNPAQGLVIMAARNDQPIKDAWWAYMQANIRNGPVTAESLSALYGLVECGTSGACRYDKPAREQLEALFRLAVREYPEDARLVTLLANLQANILGDYDAAHRNMLCAVALQPESFSYWNNLVTMQIARGEFSAARASLDRLRELDDRGAMRAEIRRQQGVLDRAIEDARARGGDE